MKTYTGMRIRTDFLTIRQNGFIDSFEYNTRLSHNITHAFTRMTYFSKY